MSTKVNQHAANLRELVLYVEQQRTHTPYDAAIKAANAASEIDRLEKELSKMKWTMISLANKLKKASGI